MSETSSTNPAGRVSPRGASRRYLFLDGAPLARWLACLTVLVAASHSEAATISETFVTDPTTRGWRIFGNTNLFAWNAAPQNLAVTWDSSQANSYFYIPLGTILDRFDDFGLALDLKLIDLAAGANTNKPSTFELAFGFLNLVDATTGNFLRGNGHTSPNLAEFDFFPTADSIEPTIWPSVWSTNSVLNYNGPNDFTLIDLPLGITMRVNMAYTAGNRAVTTSITTNGVSIGAINDVVLSQSFTDFRAGGFAIESYSDAGQSPLEPAGSLLAHGVVDNIQLTFPPPPIQGLTGAFVGSQWQASFVSRTNWLYTLERTTNLPSWTPVSSATAGDGTILVLSDSSNPPPSRAYYRVRAQRP